MNSKIIVGIIALLIIAAGVGVVWALKDDDRSNSVNQSSQSDPLLGDGGKENSNSQTISGNTEKKGMKRFSLVPVGDIDIKGDGSITLKDKLVSAAVRLTEAPSLPSGTQYEVYMVLKSGSEPIFAGNLNAISNPNAKYLWGGVGQIAWFDGVKFIITKRASGAAKPGTVVAEGVLPAKSDQLQ